MKSLNLILSFLFFALLSASAQEAAVVTETFKVYGNCGMCKTRIEKALKGVDGIQSAEWNVGKKMATVTFDSKVITLDKVHEIIASVGHDTDKVRADDAVYAKLHGCCKYERPKS